ncbi:MAG: hypothetical protein M3018_14605 [Actinomycetota bacterium]|nr:hypothetical protein [Actinomycetota bacterium]
MSGDLRVAGELLGEGWVPAAAGSKLTWPLRIMRVVRHGTWSTLSVTHHAHVTCVSRHGRRPRRSDLVELGLSRRAVAWRQIVEEPLAVVARIAQVLARAEPAKPGVL